MSQQVILNIPVDRETGVPFYDREKEKTEFLAKIARSEQQLREGKTISFTMEEIESFDSMETNELMNFLETRREESRATWGNKA
ncbi:MAG: hypothetical protein FWG65_06845 [Turicibacter sp.]|nr:hypothetical protein [Turicibacter sp.]